MDEIRFILNGQEASYKGRATDRLLDVLRDRFSCTSVKCGCGEGECGACAVLIDGRLRNSCCVAVGAAGGAEILTLECGFCTPGMVLAAEALLSRNARPDEAAIREGLSGNLCRCTGYQAIVNAVKKASEEGAGLW